MTSKKDYIRAANMIREISTQAPGSTANGNMAALFADFFEADNPRFNRERFLGYIAGTNGPSGGKVASRV